MTQKSHDSVEDAKAALAVYKFKSEVMDRHGMNLEESNFSLLSALASKYRVTIIDQGQEICGFKDHKLNTVELQTNKTEEVIDQMVASVRNGDDLVIGKIDLLQPFLFESLSE